MPQRLKAAIGVAVLVALVLVLSVLGWSIYVVFRPFVVTVHNDSASALRGLVLVSDAGYRTPVPSIAPGGSVTVSPRVATSEDAMAILDSAGRRYPILGYIEGDPGGMVLISVSGVASDGLSGFVVDRTRQSPAGAFPLRTDRP